MMHTGECKTLNGEYEKLLGTSFVNFLRLLGCKSCTNSLQGGVLYVKLQQERCLRLVKESGVKFIHLQFTDIFGMLKNVAITSEQLEKALNNKCMFDGSSIEGFVRIEESDMYLADPILMRYFHGNLKRAKLQDLCVTWLIRRYPV